MRKNIDDAVTARTFEDENLEWHVAEEAWKKEKAQEEKVKEEEKAKEKTWKKKEYIRNVALRVDMTATNTLKRELAELGFPFNVPR